MIQLKLTCLTLKSISLRDRLGLLPDEACLCFGKPFFGEPLLELMAL